MFARHRSTMTLVAVTSTSLLVVAAAAAAPPVTPISLSVSTDATGNVAEPGVADAVVAAFLEKYPDMSEEHALKVWDEHLDRGLLLETLGTLELDGFEGVDFDAQANLLHILVTNDSAIQQVTDLAEQFQVAITFDTVLYTLSDLEALATSIQETLDIEGAGQSTIAGIGVDSVVNAVNVVVRYPAVLETLPESITTDPRVNLDVLDADAETVGAVCTGGRTAWGRRLAVVQR